jgi:hypothetical protein
MASAIGVIVAIVGSLSLPAVLEQTSIPGFAGVCTESPHVADRPPDDPGASSFASPGATWFANDSRTLWAWWWGKTYTGGYKVLWVRPGQSLNVTGTRLDGPSAPMRSDVPGGYDNTYQASELYFPESGCWQIDAAASGKTLRFVVHVR